MSKTMTIERDTLSASLAGFDREVRDGLMLKVMKAGGAVLQERSRSVLKGKKLGERSTSNRGISMVRGVTLKADPVYNEVRVTIMGDFRLKWFEKGTSDRLLKKGPRSGARRGRIEATHFFAEARRSSGAEIEKAMEEEFYKQMKRILK